MGPLRGGHLNAVLLDLDGTLLDSEPLHRAAYKMLFHSRGWDLTADTYSLFVGRRGADVFAAMPGPWVGEDPDALVAEVIGYLAESDATPLPIEGATELIRNWHARGIPLALVTSATRVWAEYAVEEVLGVRECFSALVTWEDVTHGKPHPAPYLLACRELHVEPAGVSAVEDSVAGVASAVAAGVGRVIAIAGTTDHALLSEAGAHRVIESLRELMPD